MARQTFYLGGVHFDSKKELVTYLKSLLHECSTESRGLTEQERLIVADLAKMHPDYEEKVGLGFRSVTVIRNSKYGSPCFAIVRVDGGIVDFSYKRCLGI